MAGEDDYAAALLRARAAGQRISAQALSILRAALEDAARRIELDTLASDNPITQARGEALKAQIEAILERFQRLVGTTTSRSVGLTWSQIIAIHQEVNRALAGPVLGSRIASVTAGFDTLALRAATVIASRPQNAALFRTLINRHLEEVAPALDRLIIGSVASGVSTRQLTQDIAALLRSGQSLSPLSGYGLRAPDVTGLATVEFDARRIAVSETLNALREANAQGAAVSPIVAGIKWCMSGRHDGLRSSPDECDVLAEVDWYGMGPGVYPPSRYPLAPHSLCGCTPCGTVFRPAREWGLPKDPAPAMALRPDELEFAAHVGGAESWSELREARARTTVARSLGRVQPGRRRRAA